MANSLLNYLPPPPVPGSKWFKTDYTSPKFTPDFQSHHTFSHLISTPVYLRGFIWSLSRTQTPTRFAFWLPRAQCWIKTENLCVFPFSLARNTFLLCCLMSTTSSSLLPQRGKPFLWEDFLTSNVRELLWPRAPLLPSTWAERGCFLDGAPVSWVHCSPPTRPGT